MNNSSTTFHPRKCLTKFTPYLIDSLNGKLLTAAYGITFLFLLISNIALIVGLCKTGKRPLNRTSKLFLILCTSDISLAVVLMPLQISFIHITNVNCYSVATRAFWSNFPMILSGLTILLISVDRYLMCAKSTFYYKHFSGNVIVICVVMEILISLAWAMWYAFISIRFDLYMNAIYFFSIAGFEGLILLSVVIVYVALLTSVQATVKEISYSRTRSNYDRKLLKTIMMIAIALVVCYLPSVLAVMCAGYFTLYTKDRSVQKVVNLAVIWSLVATSINSGLNACICIGRNSQIKRFYKSVFCRVEKRTPEIRRSIHDNNDNNENIEMKMAKHPSDLSSDAEVNKHI